LAASSFISRDDVLQGDPSVAVNILPVTDDKTIVIFSYDATDLARSAAPHTLRLTYILMRASEENPGRGQYSGYGIPISRFRIIRFPI
jgi:hypothetical protein